MRLISTQACVSSSQLLTLFFSTKLRQPTMLLTDARVRLFKPKDVRHLQQVLKRLRDTADTLRRVTENLALQQQEAKRKNVW